MNGAIEGKEKLWSQLALFLLAFIINVTVSAACVAILVIFTVTGMPSSNVAVPAYCITGAILIFNLLMGFAGWKHIGRLHREIGD